MDVDVGRAVEKLETYIRKSGLKFSAPRARILESFARSHKHLTAEELHALCRGAMGNVGIATIYRALKLFCEAGICGEIPLENGVTLYEIAEPGTHHDHLICTRCGRFVEIVSPEIEALQHRIAEGHGFRLQNHRLNLYGLCPSCQK